MRSRAKRAGLVICIGGALLIWRAQADPDVVVAQTRKPIMVTRIYTGADGQSHAEEQELKLTDRGLSSFKASSIEFSSRPAAPASNQWHTGPRRQFVITLSGRAELEVANAQKIETGPGHIDLIEDTTGKGHITRNLEDRIVLTIPLDDQTGREGNR